MMDSKEVFDKIETCLTKALNEEDGIKLEGRKIDFEHYKYKMEHWGKVCSEPKDSKFVKVCILQDSDFPEMWHIAIWGAKYYNSAAIYAVKELDKQFGEIALVSENEHFYVEDAFGIAITFNPGEIKLETNS